MDGKLGLMVLSAAAILMSCDTQREDVSPACDVAATVVDLRSLDGCGYVFELEDGTRLEPIRIGYCGTPPMPEIPADPLDDFQFAAGKKVKISYEVMTEMGTTCMAGTPVKITCVTEAPGSGHVEE